MASFTALNLEPESDTEEEVDNTKEIQVEEALKLYQNAIKLHSHGPDFFDEADDAYSELFASEIFGYPESFSEAKRLAEQDDDESEDEVSHSKADAPLVSGVEAAPNTLPQILYLSFKNHGLFLFDRLQHKTRHAPEGRSIALESDKKARQAAKEGLEDFAEALDKDETDADLWRRTSKIGSLLGSRRIARFCLETVVDAGAPSEDSWVGGPGLEEKLARSELRELISLIQDNLADILASSSTSDGRPIPKTMRKVMEPFPQLPPSIGQTPALSLTASEAKVLTISERSWIAVGKAILTQRKQENKNPNIASDFGVAYRITLPAGHDSDDFGHMEVDNGANSVTEDLPAPDEEVQADLPTGEKTAQDEDVTMNDENDALSNLDKNSIADQSGRKDSVTSNGEALDTKDDLKPEALALSELRPSLKRNSESAGLPETEGNRSRSKRLRARAETTHEDEIDPKDLTKHYEEQLESYVQADQWLFNSVDELISRVGSHHIGTISELRSAIASDVEESSPKPSSQGLNVAFADFKKALSAWDLNTSNLLNHGNGSGASVTLIDGGNDSGLASFLEHSKPGAKKSSSEQRFLSSQGLSQFESDVNSSWGSLDDLAIHWVESILRPQPLLGGDESLGPQSCYTQLTWPSALKDIIIRVLVDEDEAIFMYLEEQVRALNDIRSELSNKQSPELNSSPDGNGTADNTSYVIELVQTIFELHLDTYGKITNPSSKVDQPTRVRQRDRIKRWYTLTSYAIGTCSLFDDENNETQSIRLRFLWSSVKYVGLIDASSTDHVLLCLKDLKRTLEALGSPTVYLRNNSIMPEISIEAAEVEISRLTTMDFFSGIFDTSIEDPCAVIDSLEPILLVEDTSTEAAISVTTLQQERIIKDSQDEESNTQDVVDEQPATSKPPISHQQQMSEFLNKASVSLRLTLWHRLKAAYDKIPYPPMVMLCNIRSMDLVLSELREPAYGKENAEDRSANLIVWIRNLADLATQSLELIRSKPDSFDCMDEKHLQIAIRSITDTIKLLHIYALWDDSIRIGQSHTPFQASGAANAYKSAMNYFRDMQPKIWMLLYYLIQEAASQNRKAFPALNTDLSELLQSIHNSFGLREYCRVGKKSYLKFMKTELLRLGLNSSENGETEMAQVIYDLYGLKVCSNSVELADHGCTADQIDRSSAIELVDFVMLQARRLNIKDVLKSEIKTACEKMQAVIGHPRTASIHQAFNRRLLLVYLRSPINPMDLYRSLKGIGGMTPMPVNTEYAITGKKGWFFLLGHILLAKYRSQKRTSPDNSDDLDDAVNFLKLDLDFDSEKWETWYRLAQTYDAKIEEDTTWSAEKINDPKSDLVPMQKAAIHCYTMALAAAMRNADASFGTATILSELYTDFGNRIYASSRPPLSMAVFSLTDNERFCNGATRGTYKREPFMQLKDAAAWTFASELFRQALVDKPDYWINWYMLGKCQWKLFTHLEATTIKYQDVLDSFIKAIECAPEKRDNRHLDKDPILDPHYKLVSVVYKLVRIKEISPEEGSKILVVTPHARKLELENPQSWKKYILQVLKSLRSADKANWHHRMVARAAKVISDDTENGITAAQEAKNELTQQIFTKTMAIQVWKPEFERAGRHFVYTFRYVRYFVKLLYIVGDRASLEALGRRVRKKQHDFTNHADIWTEICLAHLTLLRKDGSIPQAHEDTIFKSLLPFEVFTQNANRLEAWAHSQLSLSNPMLELLKETIELKKLNGNLMRSTNFDDLIGDMYARIYELIVPDLVARAGEAENRERMRIDRMLMNSDAPTPEGSTLGATQTASSRPKAIGRTEVRRRAEALVAKMGTTAQQGRPKASAIATLAPPETSPIRAKPPLLKDESAKDAISSVPGSVHDSADDESELTDIEEEEEEEKEEENDEEEGAVHKAAPLFPGLVGQRGEGEKVEKGEKEDEEMLDVEETGDQADGGVADSAEL